MLETMQRINLGNQTVSWHQHLQISLLEELILEILQRQSTGHNDNYYIFLCEKIKKILSSVFRNVTKWWREEWYDLPSTFSIHDYVKSTNMVEETIQRSLLLATNSRKWCSNIKHFWIQIKTCRDLFKAPFLLSCISPPKVTPQDLHWKSFPFHSQFYLNRSSRVCF